MLAFKTTTVTMPSTRATTSIAFGSVHFDSRIRTAEVALKGFTARFDNNQDHNFGELDIFFREIDVQEKSVSFTVALMLRDFSGEIDDAYSGHVIVLVIADLENNSPVIFEKTVSRVIME